MRGRIIFIHPETNTGLIFGADRQRYNFQLGQWVGDGYPPRNTEVRFSIKGDQALKIRPFSADEPDLPEPVEIADEAPARPAPGKGKRVPPVVDAAAADTKKTAKAKVAETVIDDTVEDAGFDFPDGPEDEDELTASKSGSVGPRKSPFAAQGGPAPLAGQVLFQDGGASRQPAWKFYLFGVLAALAFILIAYLTRHMFVGKS